MQVKEDSKLLDQEKETYFHITGDEKNKVYVTSNMRPIMEQMLECENLKIKRKYEDEDGNIVHLEGELPVTHLTFRAKPKSRNYLSKVLV